MELVLLAKTKVRLGKFQYPDVCGDHRGEHQRWLERADRTGDEQQRDAVQPDGGVPPGDGEPDV